MKLKNWLIFVRTAFTSVIFAALLVIFTFAVGAVPDNAKYIASFDSSADGFVIGENTSDADRADFYLDGGRSVSCLQVKSNYVPIDSLRSVIKIFEAPTDFSAYRKISYSIFVPEYSADAGASYYSRLILRSDDGMEFESIDTVTPGKWCKVEADISSFSGRSRISAAEISFIADTSLGTVVSDSFYIDDIFAFDMADCEMIERFLFDSYTVEGGTATLSEDKSQISIFSNSVGGVTLMAPILMPDLNYSANCLRIKLANYTDGDYFTLYYSVMDERAVSESRSIVVPIEPNSDGRVYYIPISNAGQIKELRLLFNESIGRIELISVGTSYIHKIKNYDTHGTVSCRINDDLESISFFGEISRETALENQSRRIKIYKLDGEFSDLSELDGMTPIIETAMTTKFDLTWHIPNNLKLTMLERYAAVIAGDEGEYLLISPEIYVENPEALAKNSHKFPIDAKGFYTDDLTLVTDACAEITVLEFDMSEAFSDRANGTSYTYNGEAYYLNTSYITSVEKMLDMLSGGGISVLVRIVNRIQLDSTMHDQSPDGALMGGDYIGAAGGYISEKWVADGRVCGIILGYLENHIVEKIDIGEVVTECAEALKKISVNLLKNSKDARVYLSVSDLLSSDILTGKDELPLNEYLGAVFTASSVYGKNYFGLCVESPYRAENMKYAEFISADNNGALKDLTEKQGGLKYNPIFCDEIYKKQHKYLGMLLKNYVVGYHTAIFDDFVDAYIAVSEGKFTGLADAVKVIDTTSSDKVVSPALSMLEAKSLSDVIEKFDGNRLIKKLVNEGDVSYTLPEKIMGQYKLYEFNNAADASAVSASYYDAVCRLVDDSERGTVLWAAVNHEADDMLPSVFGVTVDFEYTENFEFMSWIGVELKLCGDGANGGKVPVKLVLTAENEKFESMAEATDGEWTTVYFNVKDFKNSKDTKRLQILAGKAENEVSELRIKEIVGLSGEYNDESLESVVLEERLKKRDPDGGLDYSPYMWLGGGLLVAVATCAAVALLGRKKRVEK